MCPEMTLKIVLNPSPRVGMRFKTVEDNDEDITAEDVNHDNISLILISTNRPVLGMRNPGLI